MEWKDKNVPAKVVQQHGFFLSSKAIVTHAVCAALDSEARPLLAALDSEARPLIAPALAPVDAVDVALLAFARNRPAVLMSDTTAAELKSEILA